MGDRERLVVDTVVLDLDGTLVDSVYVHVAAWQQAFREQGLVVPSHRVHRAIGMGADRLVAHVAGDDAERDHGDAVRDGHATHLDERWDDLVALEGAGELLRGLRERGFAVVLASSGGRDDTERLLGLVPDSEALQETVTGSDADESKPAGDLVEVALGQLPGERRAVVVGDAVWDVRAAHDAGVPAIGLLSGGFAEQELRDAGAVAVVEGPAELTRRLDELLVLPTDR